MTDHHYSEDQLALDLKWWAAANYLTVAQIYLKDNTLLREPLRAEHIKPRLLGHWGTSPGLSMIYTLLNRHIVATGADWLYVTGPGHGGPGAGRVDVSRGNVLGDLSGSLGRRRGHPPDVSAILRSRRSAQPCECADTRKHPRRRRARLRPCPCGRRCLRSSEPRGGLCDRRRRSGDRAVVRLVEAPGRS